MPAECPYSAAVESFDETLLAQGMGAEIYGRLRDHLSQNEPPELERLCDRSQRLMRDLGVTFALYNEDDAADWILPYDLFPRVIDPETWKFLSSSDPTRWGVE